ncbi:DUF2283 domain-containing protein [Candidatus Woesearchaeota archaeon]|nr:DUF2283 domain-containing protein [Candidatus Woesearchaeota archaeon]
MMEFHYDPEGDILDVNIGKPKAAISREIDDDFFVRIDKNAKKVVGFMVMNFGKKQR